LLFNFVLEYAISRVQVNQDGLKFNGTHHYAGRKCRYLKKNAEVLVAATRTKEIGIEVYAHKSKYMTVSRDQQTGRIHSIKIDNSPLRGWKSSNIWEQR